MRKRRLRKLPADLVYYISEREGDTERLGIRVFCEGGEERDDEEENPGRK